jgi:hypothetical protein
MYLRSAKRFVYYPAVSAGRGSRAALRLRKVPKQPGRDAPSTPAGRVVSLREDLSHFERTCFWCYRAPNNICTPHVTEKPLAIEIKALSNNSNQSMIKYQPNIFR